MHVSTLFYNLNIFLSDRLNLHLAVETQISTDFVASSSVGNTGMQTSKQCSLHATVFYVRL